jgi:hypothetical protein
MGQVMIYKILLIGQYELHYNPGLKSYGYKPSHERGKKEVVIMTNGTYPWLSVTRFSRLIQINQMTSFLPITGKNIHIRNSCHYQIPQYPELIFI